MIKMFYGVNDNARSRKASFVGLFCVVSVVGRRCITLRYWPSWDYLSTFHITVLLEDLLPVPQRLWQTNMINFSQQMKLSKKPPSHYWAEIAAQVRWTTSTAGSCMLQTSVLYLVRALQYMFQDVWVQLWLCFEVSQPRTLCRCTCDGWCRPLLQTAASGQIGLC